ncbi:MAG: glycosyltransferase family 39 protein, partial [Nanoarchaeota archaeon]|nr:glycosyltransferase family 39 protein [Nanoarchaeota archaeon]
DLAMTSAFVMSITPLLVFFSHNVQLINPGLFFMLVSAYLYILWAKQGTKHNTHRNLIYSSLFFASAVLTKYTFAVIAIPFAFAIPFSRIKETFISMKYNWKPFAISGALLSTIMIWFVYSNYFISLKTSGASAVSSKLINLSALLSSQWWVILKSYTADNYTLIGFWMALLGIVVFLFISRNKLNFENRFILAYAVAALCFIFIMSDKLQGHSYHQYPIAPIVIFFISYLIIVVGSTSERLTNIPYLKFVVIIIAAIFLLLPSLESKDRQFDTQFFGLDIAGDYIQEHSQPDERVMYSNGQTYGLLWHADRKGYGSITDSSTLKKLEDDLNFRWIFIYAWDFPILNNPDTGVYISENYNLKQVGIVNQIPVYFLFEKGGKFNISQINEQLKDKQPQIKKYELNKGTIDLIYFNI